MRSKTFPQKSWRYCRDRRERLFKERVLLSQLKAFSRKTMFGGLFQPLHLLVLFRIALLVFGPKKLLELRKGIGADIRGVNSALKGDDACGGCDDSTLNDHESSP